MKIKKLSFGAKVFDIDLSSCPDSQLREVIHIAQKEKLVVLKGQNMSVRRFDKINDIFGLHQPAGIWACHKDFPKIFRVTNKEVSEGKKGLLSGGRFEWHSDGLFSPDPEECLALWCIEPGEEGGSTEFACGIQAYNNLPERIKKEIENSTIIITNEVSKTYLNKPAYEKLPPYAQKDIDKMYTRSRRFAGGAKGNPYEKSSQPAIYKKGKKIIKKETPLITKHPLTGDRGLYFPFYFVSEIKIKSGDLSRAKELFYILMESYVGAKGKIYKHHWDKGDLILSDQIHSLHRRSPYKGIRELYRTAFYYHSP